MLVPTINSGPGDGPLHGYSDADYNTDPITRHSVSGWCMKLGNSVVAWKAKQQGSVATSTTHAEHSTWLCTRRPKKRFGRRESWPTCTRTPRSSLSSNDTEIPITTSSRAHTVASIRSFTKINIIDLRSAIKQDTRYSRLDFYGGGTSFSHETIFSSFLIICHFV